MLAPLIIFTYNRKKHLENLISSLSGIPLANKTNVFIFSDGNKGEKDKDGVFKVREYLKEIQNKNIFRSIQIFERKLNQGLSESVINGVSEIIVKYGKAIVLEDDLIVARGFLNFMNSALDYYEKDKKIWSISAFTSDIDFLHHYDKDVFFSRRSTSWGWATWKDRWETIDWNVKTYNSFRVDLRKRRAFNQCGNDMSAMLDRQQAGLVNSWAIRWCYAQFFQDAYSVYPKNSLIKNDGQDGSGTNCNELRELTIINDAVNTWNFIPFQYNPEIDNELAKRKKVPFYKLLVSFILFVLLGVKKK